MPTSATSDDDEDGLRSPLSASSWAADVGLTEDGSRTMMTTENGTVRGACVVSEAVTSRKWRTMQRVGQVFLMLGVVVAVAALSVRLPVSEVRQRRQTGAALQPSGVIVAEAAVDMARPSAKAIVVEAARSLVVTSMAYEDSWDSTTTAPSEATEKAGGCALYGCGSAFNPQHKCQCNAACEAFASCCHDYTKTCEPEANAAERVAVGDRVMVRDSAVQTWLSGEVTSVSPFAVKPEGWRHSYKFGLVKQSQPGLPESLWRPKSLADEPPLAVEEPPKPSCLCLFDVDRTLTCKQGASANCTGTKVVENVVDTAFGGGTLVLSELGSQMNSTFCAQCYRGIVSAGDASGHNSGERAALQAALGGLEWTLSNEWTPKTNVGSLLTFGAIDAHKQETVREMVNWLRDSRGVLIEDHRVHFFDDNDLNAPPFFGSGFNARQISCGDREPGVIGYCGGLVSEIVEAPGVFRCSGEVTSSPVHHQPAAANKSWRS